jgi:serine/threonine-protein kinase
VDARADVYALGCVLHELLTGAPPFGSAGDNDPVAVALRQVNQPPEPPSWRNPRVGPELDAVVLTTMAKQPTRRYQSARALGSDLARVLAGHAPAAAPAPTSPLPALSADDTGPLPPAARQRRRAAWALLAGVVVALVVALLLPDGVAPAGRAQANTTAAPASTSLPSTTTVTAGAPSQAEPAKDAGEPDPRGRHRATQHDHKADKGSPSSGKKHR